MMDAQLKAKWVATLRSGNYVQSNGWLRDRDNHCCCLGVLCDIVAPENWRPSSALVKSAFEHNDCVDYPAIEFLDRVGLTFHQASHLAKMNDRDDPFPVIAEYIEKNL